MAVFDVQETLVVMCMIPCPLIVVYTLAYLFRKYNIARKEKRIMRMRKSLITVKDNS